MFKKIILAISVGFFIFSGFKPVKATNVNDFVIDSFITDYYLSKDEKGVSQLKTEEVISAIFPDYNQNHGIERVIPLTYKKK